MPGPRGIPFQTVLARRLRKEVDEDAIVQQLVDITKGVTRQTTYSVKAEEDGTFTRTPIEVKEKTRPDDQLRGLVVFDLLTGGELGISRIATAHSQLPTRQYDRWLNGIDPRVIASPEAYDQATNPAPPHLIEVESEPPEDEDG